MQAFLRKVIWSFYIMTINIEHVMIASIMLKWLRICRCHSWDAILDHVGSSSTLGRMQSEGDNIMCACTKQLSYIICLDRCPVHTYLLLCSKVIEHCWPFPRWWLLCVMVQSLTGSFWRGLAARVKWKKEWSTKQWTDIVERGTYTSFQTSRTW